MPTITSLLEKGIRFNSRLLTTIKDYIKYTSSTINTPVQQQGSFSDQFSDMVANVRDFKLKCRQPTPESYLPRYSYKGRIKKGIKWRQISDYDLSLQQNNEPETDFGPRRKFCMLLSYSGANYMGSQRQWQSYDNTIEEMVLKALLRNNWITHLEYRYPKRISFESASRTDKGVSAARQCFSLFAPLEKVDNFTVLNQDLPADIRIFDFRRVTRNFSARMDANARTYSYTLPTVAFSQYSDRTSMHEYRITADHLKFVNDMLQTFKGVHNFHNFTVDVKPTDQSAFRVMESLECGELFSRDGVEFAVIKIRGRSFMTHQIRKMIGLILAIVRGVVDASVFERALSMDTVDIPKAPGLGLMLDQVHYDNYNTLLDMRKNREFLIWDKFEVDTNEFCTTFIHPAIVQEEIEQASMLNWVEDLIAYDYQVVPEDQIGLLRSKIKADGDKAIAESRLK